MKAEAQEAIDKMNNKFIRHRDNVDWFFKSDQKKFGFGMPRKNRKSKRGYSYGTKESRKLEIIHHQWPKVGHMKDRT